MVKKYGALLKYHGGKFYMGPWIRSNIPRSKIYVEPFGGAASVLINKEPSEIEVYNDLEFGVYCLFKCLNECPNKLITAINNIVYKEETFLEAIKRTEQNDIFQKAIDAYILCRMSRGGLRQNFCWSSRIASDGQPAEVSYWEAAKKKLPDFAKRLSNVKIYNKSAIDIIQEFDSENTVFYCDPPYLPTTRYSDKAYCFEMSIDDHKKLSEILKLVKGKVLLSGYPSKEYDEWFSGWQVISKQTPNHSSQIKNKIIKTEILWMNF